MLGDDRTEGDVPAHRLMLLQILANTSLQIFWRAKAGHVDLIELPDRVLQASALFEPGIHLGQQCFVGNDLRDAVLPQFALNEVDELRAGHRVQLDPASGSKPIKVPEHEFNLLVGCAVVAQIGDQRGFVALGVVLVLAFQPHRGDILKI